MEEFPRIKRLPPYVFNVTGELKLAARRRGEDVIDFSMGNPDQPTPRHIVEKLVESVQRPGTHGYSVSKGIVRLRRAICNWYETRYGVALDPGFGSDRDDRLQGRHRAPRARDARSRRHRARAQPELSDTHLRAGHRGRGHPSRPDARGFGLFQSLEDAIRDSYPKPKMLIVNFPSNPTTQCVDLAFFERLVAIAREHHIYVVHDLAYADIVFDGYKAPSIMQVPGAREIAVEFFTMSKSYNMAGWRVGFMVGNRELTTALARMKSYHDYGTFTPIQVASIVALEGPQDCVETVRSCYQKRRDVLCSGLHAAGWKVPVPKATMYIWAPIPEPYKAMGSLEFSKKLLLEAHVAVAPGIGFGDYGDDHVRFALIENEARTRQAVRGIKEMFRKDGLL